MPGCVRSGNRIGPPLSGDPAHEKSSRGSDRDGPGDPGTARGGGALIRRYTTSPGQKLTPQILHLNGNPADVRGGGGTCFGDSGGPVFLNGYLVAVTSYGYTDNCRYLGGYQRVDIPVVQDWLDTVL